MTSTSPIHMHICICSVGCDRKKTEFMNENKDVHEVASVSDLFLGIHLFNPVLGEIYSIHPGFFFPGMR